jgi:hypothetical protein
VFNNRRRTLAVFAVAAAIGAACADSTAPVAVRPLDLRQTARLDTAALCPYGWIVQNGQIVCVDS